MSTEESTELKIKEAILADEKIGLQQIVTERKQKVNMSYGLIKIEPLRKDNFDTWKIHVQALLIKNDAWKYVKGTAVKPTHPPEAIAEWEENDEKAKSDLILSMSPPELQNIKNCATSKDVWDKLHTVYQSSGPARQAMLLKSLILHKMTDGGDMREHVNKFFEIVDKLAELQIIVIEEMLTILLLYSIPNEYETFRIAIESQEKLPKIEALKVKLLEEFEARKRNTTSEAEGALYVNKNNFKKNKIRGGCNNNNRNECNGKNYKTDYKGSNNNNGFKFTCHTCGKIGHKARDCKSKNFENRNQKSYNDVSCHVKEMAFNVNCEYKPEKWCLDSGATSHICTEQAKFIHFNTTNSKSLVLADNNSTCIEGCGDIIIKPNAELKVNLKSSLYVPDLRTNLLSVSKITDNGFEVIFKKNCAVVFNPTTGAEIFAAQRENGLYYVKDVPEYTALVKPKEHTLQDWHEIFGHLNENDLKSIISKNLAIGIQTNTSIDLKTCEICIEGKQTQNCFPKSERRSEDLLELVHSDVCGPMRVRSPGGSRYFVTFIDDKSRWCTVYFLKGKDKVIDKFKEFKSLVENETGKKIKCLRTDNGTEYTCNEMKNFLKSEGIRHEFTVEYTPQQNGVSERKNRTLVEMARCLLIQSGLSPMFWAEAVNTANYIRNRCPTQSLGGQTPFKMWTGNIPNVKHLQKFGCVAYMLNKKPGKGKFEPKSKKCIFVGYSDNSKAYRLWNPEAKKIERSRDVIFLPLSNLNEYTEFFPDEIEVLSNFRNVDDSQKSKELGAEEIESINAKTENDDDDSIEVRLKKCRGRPKRLKTGKKGRPRKIHPTVAATSAHTTSSGEEFHSASLIQDTDPENSAEALRGPEANEWKQAMLKEYNTLMKNGTWQIVERPCGKKIVESKWALKTKLRVDGTIDCRKARLVAKGFTQRAGIDYDETFAPVARLSSIRIMMAISAELGLEVHQLDFVSAYLNGRMETEIYMEMPADLNNVLSTNEAEKYANNKVCLLRKAIYGLKQSGRLWYKRLDEKLKEMNMIASKCDPCVYILKDNGNLTLIAIYVDDIIISSNNRSSLNRIKEELASTFEMKDLGKIKYCLGIEFSQQTGSTTISLSQSKYISFLLEKFNMTECKPVSTPANSGIKLSKDMSPTTEEEKIEIKKLPYQNLIGSLMYLAVCTRPDIAHIVSVLSQFNNSYGKEHWVAAKRVLRYLKHTKDLNLVFEASQENLKGYADADWGSNTDDRKSYTGFAFKYANACISWESRKQKTVAVSSTEAEYMALSDSAKEAIYLKRFFHELLGKSESVLIYNDNQSAQKLSKNPVFHNRTKHIDIRHHFIREVINKGDIQVEYQRTEDMLADILTKNLSSEKHEKCAALLGLRVISNKF